MDELLGLYGYDKVENDEGIQLGSSLSQSKIPITGSVASLKQNQKQNQGNKSPLGMYTLGRTLGWQKRGGWQEKNVWGTHKLIVNLHA